MRTDIYYWKCDSLASPTERPGAYFATRYDQPGLTEQVAAACADALGSAPTAVTPLRAEGNHLAFAVKHDGRRLLFRADDGLGDDDYLLAESAAMSLAADAGLPVPRVLHTDIGRRACPWRFHLVEFRADARLDRLDRAGTLDRSAIARALGEHLRRLHSVALPGYGFLDTDHLAATGEPRGLHPTYARYFHQRLDEHLGYLLRHALLTAAEGHRVTAVVQAAAPLLDLAGGVLVHRDLALWNVLGTPTSVTAIIDWDDAVSGDPADDLGMLWCFHDAAFMDTLLTAYGPLTAACHARVGLHWLRNMLWKTKLRHALGYFEQSAEFFLNTPGTRGSLREHTLATLRAALDRAAGDLL